MYFLFVLFEKKRNQASVRGNYLRIQRDDPDQQVFKSNGECLMPSHLLVKKKLTSSELMHIVSLPRVPQALIGMLV